MTFALSEAFFWTRACSRDPASHVHALSLSATAMKPLLALSFVLCFALPAQAQISTDRPGFGTSPTVVAPRTVQVEVGLPQVTRHSFTSYGTEYRSTTYSVPSLLRVGVTNNLELRAATSLFNAYSATGSTGKQSDAQLGFDEITLGAKYAFMDAEAATQVALIPEISAATDGKIQPAVGLTLATTHTTPSNFTLAATLGAAGQANDFSDTYSTQAVGTFGYSLSPKLGAYSEAAYLRSRMGGEGYIGLGATYLVLPRMQLDVSAATGLNERATDFLFGLGASYRF